MPDHINIEIKARHLDPQFIRDTLERMGADYKGCDHQIDTYFHSPHGRLKLRKGNIENSLIFYQRNDQSGPKQSDVSITQVDKNTNLEDVLTKSNQIQVKVEKKRHIYFLNNVKFHIDEVKDLGSFMEIEAIDLDGNIGIEKLRNQCEEYMEILKVSKETLIEESYSDLLMGKET